MKNRIPILLIYSRLIIGFAIVALALAENPQKNVIVALFLIGLLTDIFDGIIARKLKISTEKLRRMDSSVDQVFFICIIGATCIICPDFFLSNKVKLGILIGTEILAYAVCYLKFKKEIATHSIGAKLWTLVLFFTLIQVIFECQSGGLFALCFWFGIATRLEITAIILVLKKWTNDVPTIFHAIKLRNGKTIHRNKLFNG